jgi:hypothetical protein
MVTVRERLDSLPVAELAEVQEKLRLNAEEREALEATARRLLEAWGGVDTPPSTIPQPVAPSPRPPTVSELSNPLANRIATGTASYAEQAVWTLNSNLGRNYSALELAELWNVRSDSDLRLLRSALARSAARGWIRRVGHGRYTSIHSGQAT